MNKAILAFFGLLVSANVVAESWLCVSDQAAGVRYDSGQWKATLFGANQKYIIRSLLESDRKDRYPLSDQPNATHVFLEFGDDSVTAACEAGEEEFGFIRCGGGSTSVVFNKKSLRFQVYYALGYVIAEPNSEDSIAFQKGNTPSVTIGKCSQIE